MEVNEILDENTIIVDLDCTTKDEAIRKLTEVLYTQKYITDKVQFLDDIYKREQLGQTGIGNYIAIPHGLSSAVSKVGVAIGISQNELEWETLDGNGVKIIILFSVGIDGEGSREHLKILSSFARKLGNDDIVEALKKAVSTQEVINAFS